MWNAVNDPLFGWISDRWGGARTPRRTNAILWGGIAWAAAFLFTWFPTDWLLAGSSASTQSAAVGLHFALALCAYDGLLTLVEVNHAALLAEMTATPAARADANMWASLAAALGSVTSYPAHAAWLAGQGSGPAGSMDLGSFRTFATTLAAICALVFVASAMGLRAAGLESGALSGQQIKDWAEPHEAVGAAGGEGAELSTRRRGGGPAAGATAPSTPPSQDLTFRAFLRQLLSSPNFVLFSVFATLQAFDCTFGKTFFAPFLDVLGGGTATGSGGSSSIVRGMDDRALAVSLSFALPHLLTAAMTPLLRSHGVYTAVWLVLGSRLVVLVAGASSGALGGGGGAAGKGALALSATSGAAFLLANRVASECVCRLLYPLVLSDVIDEDTALNGGGDAAESSRAREGSETAGGAGGSGGQGPRPSQRRNMGASVAGISAFAAKLAQSAAPMVGYAVLAAAKQSGSGSKSTTWLLLLGVPAATLLLQVGLWSRFGLHGPYLRRIKELREHPGGNEGV